MIYISPSLLASDFSRLGEELRELEAAGADWAHLDVMDGHFVPNITLGAPVIKALRGCSSLVFDVHLMIDNPLAFIDDFADAGADMITVHVESQCDIPETIEKISSKGVKAALTLRPATPVETLYPYLEKIKMALIMTVEPGFGGQPFIEQAGEKIKNLRLECVRRKIDMDIMVDGGINEEKIALCASLGANAFAVGSSVFKAPDKKQAIAALRRIAQDNYCTFDC